MSDSLKANAANAQIPPGQQTVVTTNGGTTSAQVPNSGRIWFSFSRSGSAILTVNFNGATYPNVPAGEYTLTNLTTPLNLTVEGGGNAKLAWIAY